MIFHSLTELFLDFQKATYFSNKIIILTLVLQYFSLLYTLLFLEQISSKVGFLHSEVIDALYNLEQQIKTFECQPIRASIQNHISELNCLLKKERNDYNVSISAVLFAQYMLGLL